MAKMIDVGKVFKGMVEATPVHSKPKTEYPYLRIEKVPDELMGKGVGDFCRLEIVVEIKRKAIDEEDNKKTKSMTFDVHKIGLIGPAGKKTKEEYLKMSATDREAYDSEQIYSK